MSQNIKIGTESWDLFQPHIHTKICVILEKNTFPKWVTKALVIIFNKNSTSGCYIPDPFQDQTQQCDYLIFLKILTYSEINKHMMSSKYAITL